MKTSTTVVSKHRLVRLLLVATAIAACLFVIQAAARHGLSQALITYALTDGNLAAANKATEVMPKSAQAHLTDAAILTATGAPEKAISELERAVSLRPADYFLWSQLGLLRDQTGDSAGALKAFDEAIKRAPFYYQPRWNRGNVLLRSGQYEAAFNDLNQAAQSNPVLIPGLVDLAWGVSRGDIKVTEELAQINIDSKRIALARLLARRGKAQEAVAKLSEVASVPEDIKREIVTQLMTQKAFKSAFEIWKRGQGSSASVPAGAVVYDGGFEGPLSFGETGFGWRVTRDLQGASVSLDSGTPQSGAKALRVDFNGNPASPLISQVILVEPSKRYRINFASRSKDLVTGAPPIVIATDASGDLKQLGQSPTLSQGTSDWRVYSFELTTAAQTSALLLSLQRENCSTPPCPSVGSILLDSFSMEQLN